jgi:hypothetical protein
MTAIDTPTPLTRTVDGTEVPVAGTPPSTAPTPAWASASAT